jgi:hypothetical protein
MTPKEKLQWLVAKVESGSVTKAEVLELISDVQALSKGKRALEQTLAADEAFKDAYHMALCRELMPYAKAWCATQRKIARNLTSNEKQKRNKSSKNKYEELHRKLGDHKRDGLIEEQFGSASLPSLPTLLEDGRYSCLDEVLRGARIKMSGPPGSPALENLFKKERHCLGDCLSRQTAKKGYRDGYDYKDVLNIGDKLLRKNQWLSDVEKRRKVLLAIAQRAKEIAEPPINQAVQAFVKRHLACINSGK